MTDQPPAKPSDLTYEDTGAAAPLVYFDIVGAYGTMNGAVEVELATRILVPKPDGSTEVKFLSSVAPYLATGGSAFVEGGKQPGVVALSICTRTKLEPAILFPKRS